MKLHCCVFEEKLPTFIPFWIVRHTLACVCQTLLTHLPRIADLDKSATVADVGRFVTQADAEEQEREKMER